MDPKVFGNMISTRRKAQMLTQEQMGENIGVTAQAISKWENGECFPDITLLPAICKVLAISSDVLLGVESNLGLENLAVSFGKYIKSCKDINECMNALAFLHYGKIESKESNWNPVSNGAYNFEKVGFKDYPDNTDFWSHKGIFLKIYKPAVMDETRDDMLEMVRVMLDTEHWPLICSLLQGAKTLNELVNNLGKDESMVNDLLESLISKGVVIHDIYGYRIYENNGGLLLAIVLKAIVSNTMRPGGIFVNARS